MNVDSAVDPLAPAPHDALVAGRARRVWWLGAALAAATLVLAALGVAVGSQGWEPLAARGDAAAAAILWDIRLPRSLGAWFAGALLGLAGAVAQGLFRNPLADPYLMGSATGAAFGVSLLLVALGSMPGTVTGLAHVGLAGAGFLGAVSAVLLTLVLARGVQHTLRLLLAGVIVGVVFGALAALVMFWAPEVLRAMQAFLLGTTGFLGWGAVALLAAVLLAALALSVVLAPALDALALGESTAASLGLPMRPVRIGLVVAIGLATGAAVAQVGLIAFVGLVAPHTVRSAVQPTHRALLVLSALSGGVLLLAADVFSRWLLAPRELPVGVLTALLGGGYLLWLMHRRPA